MNAAVSERHDVGRPGETVLQPEEGVVAASVIENIPELGWRYGFYAALGVMGFVCGALYWRFRNNDWL